MYYAIVKQLIDLAASAHELLTREAIPYQFIDGIDFLLGEGPPQPRRVIGLFPIDAPIKPQLIDGFPVAPVEQLLLHRLTRNKMKDMMYLRDMLDVGLITPEMEVPLPPALRDRLEWVKAHE
jgi:hypothetical protein